MDDAFDGACRGPARGVGGLVDEGAVVDGVREVAFLFQALQHRANGGLLEGAGDGLLHVVGGAGAVLPDEVEDFAFPRREGGADETLGQADCNGGWKMALALVDLTDGSEQFLASRVL